jgi:hypothetical protein
MGSLFDVRLAWYLKQKWTCAPSGQR